MPEAAPEYDYPAIESHIRALMRLMGILSPEMEEYLRHGEYGLALEILATGVSDDAPCPSDQRFKRKA